MIPLYEQKKPGNARPWNNTVSLDNLIQMVSFSNNMEYEEADDAEDVKAGSFYTTPNGNNTSFSFFREDKASYHSEYPYKEISDDRIKEITIDLGYSASEVDTDEFQENIGCIDIKDNVFVGSNSTILPNVTIGPDTIIAAGSLINKSIPGNGVYGGGTC